jgi:hypothetical protein
MTRGYQLYKDQERRLNVVWRLQNIDFPELGDNVLDTIIDQY